MRLRVDAPRGQALADVIEKWLHHCTRAAADDDDVRFEQIDYIAEPDAQILGRLFQDFGRQRIAFAVGAAHHLTGNPVRAPCGKIKNCRLAAAADFLGGTAGDSGTRSVSFDAAQFAASAAGAAIIDSVVATFGGRAGSSMVDMAIADDAGPDAGPDGRTKNISITLSSAPQCLCQ